MRLFAPSPSLEGTRGYDYRHDVALGGALVEAYATDDIGTVYQLCDLTGEPLPWDDIGDRLERRKAALQATTVDGFHL